MSLSPNAAVALLKPNLDRHPDKVAIIAGERAVSYRRLDDQSSRFGSLLRTSGISAGDRVAIVANDSPEYFFALLGCLKAGAVPVLLNPGLGAADYDFIFRDSVAAALVTETAASAALQTQSNRPRPTLLLDDPEFAGRLASAQAEFLPHTPSNDDIALLLYSSGSTGTPKGVPHRHGDFLSTADAFAGSVLAMSERDIVFSASKLFFAYGLGNSFSFPLRFGATVVLSPGKPDSADILRIISQHRVTVLFGVPVVYTMLLKTMDDRDALSSLRLCVSAGESLPAPLCREWTETTGIEILDGIGSTEALHIYISNRPGAVRPGSAGTRIPPFEVRLVDDEGRPIAMGTAGHLLLRGPSIAPCYWNRPEKTAETMLPGGWLRTGDIFLEEDGFFFYQGRSDDLFKVDAHWVSPIRIESALMEHPAVMECAVSRRKVEHLVRPIAFAVLNPGYEPGPKLERELRRFVAGILPPYMCPVQVEWVDELPKTATGKVQRFLLRKCG
jgi:benzoate-CoA ligase